MQAVYPSTPSLPEDVWEVILGFVPPSASLSERGTCKLFLSLVRKRIDSVSASVLKVLPVWLLGIISLSLFLDAQRIEFRRRWCGGTGYIDSVREEEVKEGASFGVDCWGRGFCVLKKDGKVVTLFQRYTGGEGWRVGTMYSVPGIFGGDAVDDHLAPKLQRWLL